MCPSGHYRKNYRERCRGHCINNEHWKFLEYICIRPQVTNNWKPLWYVLHSSQRVLIYPTWQPLEHTPLAWPYRSLFMQCRLQRLQLTLSLQYPTHGWLHLIPNHPITHSVHTHKKKNKNKKARNKTNKEKTVMHYVQNNSLVNVKK